MIANDEHRRQHLIPTRRPLSGLLIVLALLCGPLPGSAAALDHPYDPAPPHDVSHEIPPCACHMNSATKGQTPTSPDGIGPFYVSDEFLSAKCTTCHDTRCAHPSDVPAASQGPGVPLGKDGATTGRVICTTCHNIHGRKFPPFLRALGDSKDRQGGFSCDACHPGGRFMIHGKSGSRFEPECAFCHASAPGPDGPSLKRDVGKLCLLCHPTLPQSCLTAVEPKTLEVLKHQIGEIALPLEKEKMTCGSCHRAMAAPDGRKLLRPIYNDFRAKVVAKNLHRSGLLCTPCHGTEVRKGERRPVITERDPEKACRVCHDNRRARADIHPSGVVPVVGDNIFLPGNFPLHEGKMVCPTCHRMCWPSPQGGEGKMLRGGPYKDREDVCFWCHNVKGYMGFNPHRQLDPSGKINDKICLYCHSSLPDTTRKGIGKEGFVGELRTYCVGCHRDDKMVLHPANAQHFGAKPSGGMQSRIRMFEEEHKVIFPRGPEGEVLCFSCHNPHQDNVLSGDAAVMSLYNRLRRSDRDTYVVCNACHGGGGLK